MTDRYTRSSRRIGGESVLNVRKAKERAKTRIIRIMTPERSPKAKMLSFQKSPLQSHLLSLAAMAGKAVLLPAFSCSSVDDRRCADDARGRQKQKTSVRVK
jgi:hypothetical protein